MRLHASNLLLPLPSPSSVSSLLVEPSSKSLALLLSNTSALLLPNFSSPSNSTPTPIPPVSSAACFLRLLPSAHVLFLSAAPSDAGSKVHLRAWALAAKDSAFAPADISFGAADVARPRALLDCVHGLGVRLAGSVNVFVVHFLAAASIWVFAVKPFGGVADGKEGDFSLIKCAAIELMRPVYSIGLSTGFLLLGEVDGVRVYPLRPLIKGRLVKVGKLGEVSSDTMIGDQRKNKRPNGVVVPPGKVSKSSGGQSGCECDHKDSGKGGASEEKIGGCCAQCEFYISKVQLNFI